MKITMKDREYTFLVGYQKDNRYRTAFNDLVKKVFGLSFEEWYRAGYWNEKYIPYTLFDGENAAANVSVNIMDFVSFGDQRRYIQLGTVLTHENYRNNNLSRFLMEKVLAEWTNKCDFIYLYANKSVLEMYPKFGFDRVNEYEYYKTVVKGSAGKNVVKLDMDVQSDRDVVYNYATNSQVFAKVSMKDNADLVMFYCISLLKQNIYYIKSLDVIALATFNDNQLHLWDVFGKTGVELDKIIYSLLNLQTDEVVLGFTPEDCGSYKVGEIHGDDVLFVQKGKTNIFDGNKVMFPLLSHA
jgi:hypothetical protein